MAKKHNENMAKPSSFEVLADLMYSTLTESEISRKFNVSREWVRQLKNRAKAAGIKMNRKKSK